MSVCKDSLSEDAFKDSCTRVSLVTCSDVAMRAAPRGVSCIATYHLSNHVIIVE
jgi:hypothetical protein